MGKPVRGDVTGDSGEVPLATPDKALNTLIDSVASISIGTPLASASARSKRGVSGIL